MLFTSPTFMFIFLPVAITAYLLVPKAYKKYALPFISCTFYILACLKAPFSIVLIAVSVAANYIFGKMIVRRRRRLTVIVAVVTNIVIFLTLQITYNAMKLNYIYPIGASIWLIAAISYILDIYRTDAESNGSFIDTVSYLTYFPVIVAGPIIKFKDFIRLTNNIDVSMSNFAKGAKAFAIGFVKKIAVAAVLSQALESISGVVGTEINFALAGIFLMFICLIVLFSLSGYSDMGVGLSYMFGIPLESDYGNVFSACTVGEYRNRFMYSLSLWINDYILFYIHRKTNDKSRKKRTAVESTVLTVVFFLWFGIKPSVFPILAIIALIVWIDAVTDLRTRINRAFVLRIIGRILTLILVCMLWSASKINSFSVMFEYMKGLFSSSAPSWSITDIFSAFSLLKVLTVCVIGFILFIPLTETSKRICGKMPAKLLSAVDVLFTVFVFALFVLSIFYFLPQFPQYAASAFDTLVI